MSSSSDSMHGRDSIFHVFRGFLLPTPIPQSLPFATQDLQAPTWDILPKEGTELSRRKPQILGSATGIPSSLEPLDSQKIFLGISLAPAGGLASRKCWSLWGRRIPQTHRARSELSFPRDFGMVWVGGEQKSGISGGNSRFLLYRERKKKGRIPTDLSDPDSRRNQLLVLPRIPETGNGSEQEVATLRREIPDPWCSRLIPKE